MSSATFRCRIIPAYAGSTRFALPYDVETTDHPRIRGEHVKLPPIHLRSGGSSPHTRGALAIIFSFGLRMRIIPAYAGSTQVAAERFSSGEDHPRIRGEHRRILPIAAEK